MVCMSVSIDICVIVTYGEDCVEFEKDFMFTPGNQIKLARLGNMLFHWVNDSRVIFFNHYIYGSSENLKIIRISEGIPIVSRY